MNEPLFIHSMFVSYTRDTPSGERIPYTSGAALTPELLARLERQILSGQVRAVRLEDESGEDSMAADFREGWATVYLVKECHNYYELVNAESPDSDEPLDITGDGPTPKKHATRDIPLMAGIIAHFARTGEPLPACPWERTIH